MDKQTENAASGAQLKRYLSPLGVWALSFGCAVGWGAFVMSGTTFLPAAGRWARRSESPSARW